jgi:hypothetical protein
MDAALRREAQSTLRFAQITSHMTYIAENTTSSSVIQAVKDEQPSEPSGSQAKEAEKQVMLSNTTQKHLTTSKNSINRYENDPIT